MYASPQKLERPQTIGALDEFARISIVYPTLYSIYQAKQDNPKRDVKVRVAVTGPVGTLLAKHF